MNAEFSPSPEALQALLHIIAPESQVVSIHRFEASYSNHTHQVEIESPDGKRSQIVTRCYSQHGIPQQKAIREFEILSYLQDYPEIPVPKPLYKDSDGSILGLPGIVTGFAKGEQIEAQPESVHWTQVCTKAARMLAKIHAVSIDPTTQDYLLDGNAEVVWFLKGDEIPDYMQAHPDGSQVWQAVYALRPKLQPVKPRLVHVDYWSGNLLWEDAEISAIVDWEEASYGDPGIDVAYCLMELYLEGMDAAAAEFLQAYEQEAGQPVENLAYWQLAAAARPMIHLDDWLTRPFMAERFRKFIANALQNAGYTPVEENA